MATPLTPTQSIVILIETQRSRRTRVSLPTLLILVWLTTLATQPLHPQTTPTTVRIAVLTLFHPHSLILSTPTTAPVTLHDLTAPISLPPGSFTLTVPGKLTRTYFGALTITPQPDNSLLATIDIDPELAVASIVAAEAPPHAPLEALKAQAIVSRSYLLANLHAHPTYDACDTTHCQFLRSPPLPGSPSAAATRLTRHVVLTWLPPNSSAPHIVRAMYSRSCGGHTHPHPSAYPADYPFYSVTCPYCLRHPELWSRPVPTSATPLTERQRIAYNRLHGWSALPSLPEETSLTTLRGRGTGHGIGLCQLGAADLARTGENSSQILAHFFPNTTLLTLP